MSIFSCILLIAAVAAAIFSGSIDKAVNGNNAVRKVILVFSSGAICVILLPLVWALF